MLGLPLEVYRYIRQFVLPLRRDWRTCKVHEARLIHEEVAWRMLNDPDRDDLENYEIQTWSLYGMIIANTLYIGGRSPLIPPNDSAYQNNPREWYRHRLQWFVEGGLFEEGWN
jgi:hypothetical protein